MAEHKSDVSFTSDAVERIVWSTVEGACTGALTAWGAAAFTTLDGLGTFFVAVAIPTGLAAFTAIKTLAAKHLGNPDSAAIG